MKGLIFILHGRRHQRVTTNFAAIEASLKFFSDPSAIGLLEGTEQTLEEAVLSLQEEGVTEFVFLPVLLFPATHVQIDLPTRADQILPEKNYRILPTLGQTQAVVDFYSQQINQCPLQQEVLLIAHGTPHYHQPYQELTEVAARIAAKTQRKVTPLSYLGDHSYKEYLKNRSENFVIAPLFLTSGYLLKKIQAEIAEIHGTKDLWLETLENQPALSQAIKEILEEY